MNKVTITVTKDDGSSITYYVDASTLNVEHSRLESGFGTTTINLTGQVLRIKNDLK